MSLKSTLKALVDELDRTHRGAFSWSADQGFPEFSTAENGLQRFFTKKAREALWQLSDTLHQNRPAGSLRIELANYQKIVRQAVADMHAADQLSGFNDNDDRNILPQLRNLIEERLARLNPEYTHYFPAWTLGMEKSSPYPLGPVTFFSKLDWIDSVDFPTRAKDNFLNQSEANHRWRKALKEAIEKPNGNAAIDGLAGPVYSAIGQCSSLIKVTIQSYEQEFSRKLARLVCKTALDSISLGIGARECFVQQSLQDERLPPVSSDSFIETNGLLWLPGSMLGGRIPLLSPQRMSRALEDMKDILPAFAA